MGATRIAIVSLVAIVLAGPVPAAVIDIDPPQPSSDDVVRITVSGGAFPDSCYAFEPSLDIRRFGIAVAVAVRHTGGPVCLTVITGWHFTYEVGPLPPGSYEVTVCDGVDAAAASFAVGGAGEPLAACAGDCDGDELVTVGELLRGVNAALGGGDPACAGFPPPVDVASLLAGVRNGLDGCSAIAACSAPCELPFACGW